MSRLKYFLLLVVFFSSFLISDSQYFGSGGCDPEECGSGQCADEESCLCIDRWGGPFCNESAYCERMDSCSNRGNCSTSDSLDGFECTCNISSGYAGNDCSIRVCSAENDTNGDINATFAMGLADELVSSEETCPETPETSEDFAGKPIGTKKCGPDGTWVETLWINCSASFEDLSIEDQLAAAVVITSDPATIVVEDFVMAFNAVTSAAATTTEKKQTDNIFATINNLVEASNDEVMAKVREQANEFLNTINTLVSNIAGVKLEYTNTESSVVVGVPGSAVPVGLPSFIQKTARATSYSISLESIPSQTDKFAGSNFNLNTLSSQRTEPLYATSNQYQTFNYFYGDPLFPDESDAVVESPVLSAQQDGMGLEAKFYLYSYYSALDRLDYLPETVMNKIFSCAYWNGSATSWFVDNSLCVVSEISASEIDLNNYVTCNCTTSGYFAVVSNVVYNNTGSNGGDDDGNKEPVNSGLTGGEIAGIVIGSVAGAIIIFGGIGYVIKKNKKKKKKAFKTPVQKLDTSGQDSSDDENIELGDRKDKL